MPDENTTRTTGGRLLRALLFTIAASAGLLWGAGVSSAAADGTPVPPEAREAGGSARPHHSRLCRTMLDKGRRAAVAPATLVKRVTRVDRADGSAVFTVTLEGTDVDVASSVSVLDCVWIDTDADGRWNGERLLPFRVDGADVVQSGASTSVVFTVRVAGAAGATVCDAAATLATPQSSDRRASRHPGRRLSARSSVVCVPSGPDPVIPEVPAVPLLTVSAVVTLWLAVRVRLRAATR